MYKYEYIRYLNLPQVPEDVLSLLNRNFKEYEKKASPADTYIWSDSFNEEINKWCQQNICDSMYWGFQIITGDLPIHKDTDTLTKLNYVVETGGDNVATEFYNDDQQLMDSVVIEPYKWHVLKADAYHSVKNVAPGKVRFGITGRIY